MPKEINKNVLKTRNFVHLTITSIILFAIDFGRKNTNALSI